MPTLLCVLILILVSPLSLFAAVARPVVVRQSPRQNHPILPPSTLAQRSVGGGTTWTYNYWWPYPPPGATIVSATANTLLSPATTITLILPEPTSDHSQDQTSIDSRPFNDPSSFPTITALSITPPATASSSAASELPLTNKQGSENVEYLGNQPRKFNIFYLLPLFAVVGVVVLAGIIWLLYGCCTRKPKYRPPLHPPLHPSCTTSGISQSGTSGRFDYDKKVLDAGFNRGADADTFKAFRYEDLTVDSDHQYSLEDTGWDNPSRDSPPSCRHTRDFGFKCDCRQSLIESEQYQYRWPRTQLQDVAEHEGVIDGSESNGSEVVTPKQNFFSSRIAQTSGTGPDRTFSPPEILSAPSLERDLLSQSGIESESETEDEKHRLRDDYINAMGSTETIRRQDKLLELVQLHQQRRRRILRRGVTNATKKSRALTKSMKSARSTKTFKTALTTPSVYSSDSAATEVLDQNGLEGFQMLVESPPPLAISGAIKPLRVGTRRKVCNVEGGDDETIGEGWMGKMAEVISSSFSQLSGGGKDEDKYTALPEPSRRERHLGSRLVGKNRTYDDSSTPRRRPSKLSRHASRALKACKSSRRRRDTVESTADASEEEIARQRRRLQRHRESIASLPAGMMYSPALLGVNVFGEERATDSSNPSAREKQLPRPPR